MKRFIAIILTVMLIIGGNHYSYAGKNSQVVGYGTSGNTVTFYYSDGT